MNEIQNIFFEETNKMDYLIYRQGCSKRIVPEEYSTYHYYHTIYPGLSNSEEYAKSDFDGWFLPGITIHVADYEVAKEHGCKFKEYRGLRLSICQFCKTRTSLRYCKLYQIIICRFCCREKQSYDKCEGCSYRVWTPNCSEAINYGGPEASPARRIVSKLPEKISPIPFYKKTGRVYVMRSQTDQKLVKIGCTYRSAEKRLKDINKTSYRYAYDRYYRELHLYVELEILSGGHFLEKITHQFLKKLKRNIKGEVFNCTTSEIKILFKNYILKKLVT